MSLPHVSMYPVEQREVDALCAVRLRSTAHFISGQHPSITPGAVMEPSVGQHCPVIPEWQRSKTIDVRNQHHR